MKRLLALVALSIPVFTLALVSKDKSPFAGRWDITITTPNSTYPGWLEVVEKDAGLEVRMQPRSGSVRPSKDFKMEGSKLTVPVDRMAWELTAEGDRLTGTLKRGTENAGQITGVRAPALKAKAPKAWSKAEPIFNGKDMTGWEPIGNPANSHWMARDGVLVNETKGANLRTTRTFNDFKLHVELNCPDKGNSGIYLRGRYEMQVEYEAAEDTFHRMGAIYGMVPTTAEFPRKPGEWETFDVTLVGRYVTVVRNGITAIDNQEIAGITGGALDSNEAEPGPFYIQGDHTGGIQFRNITISVPKN